MTFVLPGGLGQDFAGVVYTTWATNLVASPYTPPGYYCNGTVTFSNNNRTAIPSSGNELYVSSKSYKTSGKLYFEITFAAGGTDAAQGLYGGFGNANWLVSGTPGFDTTSVSMSSAGGAIPATVWTIIAGSGGNTQYSSTKTPANGDIIGVAVDLTTSGHARFNFNVNGTWVAQGTNTTTFPTSTFDYDMSITAGTGGIIAAASYSSGTMTLNSGNAAFHTAPPAGYTAWG